MQLSAAFPFVGYLILFNDDVSKVLNLRLLDDGLVREGSLDLLWHTKLYLIYFGLLFLGLGSFLYQLRCPRVIKKHIDWEDYVQSDGGAMSAEHISSLEKILDVQINATLDAKKSMVLQRWYADQSNTKPITRLSVAVFFLFGLSLLAIPSALSFLKIAKLFFAKLAY